MVMAHSRRDSCIGNEPCAAFALLSMVAYAGKSTDGTLRSFLGCYFDSGDAFAWIHSLKALTLTAPSFQCEVREAGLCFRAEHASKPK